MRYSHGILALIFLGMAYGQAVPCRADLVVYEGFNGYTTFSPAPAPNANTIGLNTSVAYAGTGVTGLGIGTGLTFSSLNVSGDSASFTGGTLVASARLSLASPFTGTLWGSYLINLSVKGSASGNGAEVRISNDDTTTGIRFRTQADSRNTTSNTVSIGYDDVTTDGSLMVLADNTTYLVVSRFTNVGTALSAGTQGIGTMFVVTAAQFDEMLASGNPEAFLDTSAIGGLSTQVTARVSDTVSSGTFSMATGNRVHFVEVGDSGRVDEIRFGSTLFDVTPVPEPGGMLLALCGIAIASLTLRRRSSRSVDRPR